MTARLRHAERGAVADGRPADNGGGTVSDEENEAQEGEGELEEWTLAETFEVDTDDVPELDDDAEAVA